MSADAVFDLLAAILLLLGGILTVAAGLGLIRFPDAPSRLHAATKPQVLGLILVLIALALSARSWSMLLMLIPVIVFQMLTAPISAHIIGRAAYRTGNIRRDLLYVDDLADALDEERANPTSDRRDPPKPSVSANDTSVE